ncbi:YdgH/BhsA/McbA-like domain containing protein [Pantoea sp.]|uniref:YdgH/BhsA/McbA-like domain containing protein n=1 Tax=Pantoea sp. TaxID=69393 RepID=UPI00289BDDBA|nr:YdgH/BhsA/McbA-like domain containing protein [Pantoea sp.]
MKKLTAVLAGVLLTAASSSIFAATQVDSEQAQGMRSIGNVSVSNVTGSMDDATRQLSQKAEEAGATHYRIIGVENPGDSSQWSGSAELYR